MRLVRNRILVETFWHPDVKENRTLIRLNHACKVNKVYESY